MQIRKTKSPNRVLIIVLAIIILALVGVGSYFVWQTFGTNDNTDQGVSQPVPASDSGDASDNSVPASNVTDQATPTDNDYYQKKYDEVPANNTTDATSDNNRFLLPEGEY